MGKLLDALDNLRVETPSPNGFVQATVTRQGGTKVTIDPRARRECDEDTLAEEIESAICKAWGSMQDEINHLVGREPNGNKYAKHKDKEAIDEMRKKIEGIEAKATSKRKYVEAWVSGKGEIFLSIASNIVRRTDIPTVTIELEVNEAVADARLKWLRSVKSVQKAFR
jgi:DNA-binding protein YbaB